MGCPVASAGKLGIIYFDESAPFGQRYYLGYGESGDLPDISKTTGEKNRRLAREVVHKHQCKGWIAVVWDKQGREGMEAIKLLEPDKDKHRGPWLYNKERRRAYYREKKALRTTYVLMAWADQDERTWECAADLVTILGGDRCRLLQMLYDGLRKAYLDRDMDQVR